MAQQPEWANHPDYLWSVRTLTESEPLVAPAEIRQLTAALARVAAGEALVLQAGDCVESFHEATPANTARKLEVLRELSAELERVGAQPVVSIGRLGGQYAKPRSHRLERSGLHELLVFRGHMINSEVPTSCARRHDPARMVMAYQLAAAAHRELAQARSRELAKAGQHEAAPAAGQRPVHGGPWSSHEALVLDYERALIRRDSQSGAAFLGSAHLPWIGDRTRAPGSPHVRLLASVLNPVACKVGPGARPADVASVCALLDPDRVAGRLVLIPRVGARHINGRLASIVREVQRKGHRPVWLCDPMHGNTVLAISGMKTRHLAVMMAEARAFRRILRECGARPAGLHLEVAADPVTECVGGPVAGEGALTERYTTLCDPRLNPEQAHEMISDWR